MAEQSSSNGSSSRELGIPENEIVFVSSTRPEFNTGKQHDDDFVDDGAVDFHGRPSVKSKTGNWKACVLIFACEVSERFAYFSIASNLGIYLTTVLGEDVAVSATNVNNWSGTVNLTPLIGAFIADAYLGRFITLVAFSCEFLLAMVLVLMSVTVPSLKPPPCQRDSSNILTKLCPQATNLTHRWFYFALYMMALGAGGIKACVSAFAGDQFDETDAVEAMRKLSYPNWWLLSISIGSTLAISVVVYIQDAVGWVWGFGVPTVFVGLVATAFFLGTPLYRNHPLSGSPFVRVVQVLIVAVRNWRMAVPSNVKLLHEVDDKEAINPSSSKLILHTPGLMFLDKAATPAAQTHERFFDEVTKPINPWKLCTVTQVEEVKLLVRMLPIWATNMVTYALVYAQVTSLFVDQATTLNRHMGPHFQIPAASMSFLLHLTIIICLPFYDKFFVPIACRVTGNPRGLTILQRIGVGQVICTISIAVAALVEMWRLKIAHSQVGISNYESNSTLPMSVFWLLPQHLLMGASEVFLSAGQMEFFVDQAPESMRSLGNALYISTLGLGNFISGILITVVTKLTWNSNGGWLGNDLNRSHMDYFYWLLAGLTVVNFIAFLFCGHLYSYKLGGNDCSKSPLPESTSSEASADSKPSSSVSPASSQLWGHSPVTNP